MTRQGGDDAGFSLVELLMVIAISGFVTAAIGAALTVGLRNTEATGERLSQSVDTQLLSAYFPQDVQSAGRGPTDVVYAGMPSPVADSTAGCTGLTGTNVLALRWTQAIGAVTTSYGATYRTLTDAGENRLLRFSCGPSGTRSQVVARNLASSSATEVRVFGDVMRLTLTMAAPVGQPAYRATVTGTRRTVSSAAYVPPAAACTVAASLSPEDGTAVSNVLVPVPVLSATGTASCGPLEAVYAPDGSTTVVTPLIKTGNSYTAVLVATGWTGGDRPVSVVDASTGAVAGNIPFSVTEAAACSVGNARTQLVLDQGTRSRNPSVAPLAEGAVTVTADFGPTCGADVQLVFDTTKPAAGAGASTLTFPALGLERSVTIAATTGWSDGPHTLEVRQGGVLLDSVVVTVVPAPCRGAGLVLSEENVQLTGSDKVHLNKDVIVALTTSGVCSELRVGFTPGDTVESLPLAPDANFSSWGLTVKGNGHTWTAGDKTFTGTTSERVALTPPSTDVLKVK